MPIVRPAPTRAVGPDLHARPIPLVPAGPPRLTVEAVPLTEGPTGPRLDVGPPVVVAHLRLAERLPPVRLGPFRVALPWLDLAVVLRSAVEPLVRRAAAVPRRAVVALAVAGAVALRLVPTKVVPIRVASTISAAAVVPTARTGVAFALTALVAVGPRTLPVLPVLLVLLPRWRLALLAAVAAREVATGTASTRPSTFRCVPDRSRR